MAQEYIPIDPGGSLDEPKDAGAGNKGAVSFWNMQLQLASKKEKQWREAGQKTWERYRNDPMPGEGAYGAKKAGKNRFNILYANVQTRAPALYNSTPIPDVRQRFRDDDPKARVASQVLERCLVYTLDAYDFDNVMEMAVLDEEIVGRAVSRVRYTPTMQDQTDAEGKGYQEVVDEQVTCEAVQWDEFRMGPGRTWQGVTWVAFLHTPTLDEAREKFGAVADKVPLDYDTVDSNRTNRSYGQDESDPNVLKRMRVWEIWDKTARKVRWVAPSYPDDFVKVEDDYLNLIGFFPCPRPLYAIPTPTTTVPVERYRQYQEQAEELDKITRRIMALVGAMKIRGAYHGGIQQLGDILTGEENKLVALTQDNLEETLRAAGMSRLEDAIWLLPIETIAAAIEKLYLYRQQIIEIIYQIDGTADIMRGESDPNETLGAQAIKSQWGSLRLQSVQREVQRYARDIIRLQAEIIAEKFSPEQLSAMSSIKLPTAEEKQAAMMQMQVAAMQGQQQPIPGMGGNGGPPMEEGPMHEAEEVLKQPTWEEVVQLLRSDMQRGFRVDIETDSTIQNDIAKTQANIGGFIQGFASFVQAMAPAIEGGFMSMDTASKLFKSFARSFQLGKEAEDAIDEMAENPPPAPTTPDPMAEANLQMQTETMKAEAQARIDAGKAEAAAVLQREKIAADQAIEAQRLQAETVREQVRIEFDRQESMNKLAMEERIAVLQIKSQETIEMMKAEQNRQNAEIATRLEEMKIAVQREQYDKDAERAAAERMSESEDEKEEPEEKPPEDKTGPALVAAIAGMTAVMDRMQQPRRVVRGSDGKVTGIE